MPLLPTASKVTIYVLDYCSSSYILFQGRVLLEHLFRGGS